MDVGALYVRYGPVQIVFAEPHVVRHQTSKAYNRMGDFRADVDDARVGWDFVRRQKPINEARGA